MIWLPSLILFFLVPSIFESSNQSGLNVDLIFSLQEHFQSTLILLEKETVDENLTKKLMKFKETQPMAFVGFISVNSNFESPPHKPLFSRFNNIIVISNERTRFIENLVKIQNSNPIVITSFIWIHFNGNTGMAQELDPLIIPYHSKFYLVREMSFLSYDIIEVYQMGPKTSKIYSSFAHWENKTLTFPEGDPYSIRMNLRGYEIQLAITPRSRSGGSLDLWDLLSEGMNFTYKVASTTLLGGMSQNGTKSGLFKVIYDSNNVDSGPDDFVVTNERLAHYDFIFPTKIAQAKLYMALTQGMNWSSFTAPFKVDIWISVAAWIAIVSFFMLIIQHLMKYTNEQLLDDPTFLIITAFCNQGRDTKSIYFSLYICSLMPYLLAIVLFQHYSGLLLSYLTIEESISPFKNFRDVVNDGNYKISSHYPSFAWFYLNSQNDSDAKRINQLLVPKDELMAYSQNHFESLCMHRWIHINTPFNQQVKVNCNVIELPDPFLSYPLGIITKKDFPYKQSMINMVRHLKASGFLKMHLKDVIVRPHQNFKPIHLGTVLPVFLILVSFICLSGLILLCEITLQKLKNREI